MKYMALLLALASLAPLSHHQCRCDVQIRFYLGDKKQEVKLFKSGSIGWFTCQIPIKVVQNTTGKYYSYDSLVVEVNPPDHWYDKFLKP
jgi:hypothetical protein